MPPNYAKEAQDIVVSLGLNNADLKAGLAESKRLIKQNLHGLRGEALSVKASDLPKGIKKDQLLGINQLMHDQREKLMEVTHATQRYNEAQRKAQETAKKAAKTRELSNKSITRQANYQRRAWTSINEVTDSIEEQIGKQQKAKHVFRGYAMSIMFFGMAMQRMFGTIRKSSIKSFQDITHSVEGNVTGFDTLQSSMKYLGFTIGQALEPFAEWLAPIIDGIATWISENPKLVAAIMAIGEALGAVFFVGGTLSLAQAGFSQFKDLIVNDSAAAGGAITTNIGDKLTKVSDKLAKPIGTLSILYAFKEAADAIAHFKKGETWSGTIEAMQSGLFAAGGGMILKGKKGGGWLVAIAVGLELVEKGVFFQTLGTVLAPINALFATLIEGIKHDFANGIFEGILRGAIKAIVRLSTAGLGGLIGIDDLIIQRLERAALLKPLGEFDFGGTFKEAYGQARNMYRDLDTNMNNFISEADAAAAQQVTINNYGNFVLQPQPGETEEDFGLRILELAQGNR